MNAKRMLGGEGQKEDSLRASLAIRGKRPVTLRNETGGSVGEVRALDRSDLEISGRPDFMLWKR